jgi:hypothetical protein
MSKTQEEWPILPAPPTGATNRCKRPGGSAGGGLLRHGAFEVLDGSHFGVHRLLNGAAEEQLLDPGQRGIQRERELRPLARLFEEELAIRPNGPGDGLEREAPVRLIGGHLVVGRDPAPAGTLDALLVDGADRGAGDALDVQDAGG